MTVQIVEIGGHRMAVLPAEEFDRLIEQLEDRDDHAAAERAEHRRVAGEEEYLPFEMVQDILNGGSALRAWREFRKLPREELARKANVKVAEVSDIENGLAQGEPAVWRTFADVLGASVDDIMPNN
jgi:ribosome-binding protein aMBF1 (putative translation factor)